MDAVQISNVTKTFGAVTAVDDLSLTVPEGSVYGFIGPNGSGKTTTMRMIASIFYPDRGDVRVFGKQMLGARSELIGYLPEERGLYRKMAVQPLLEFYGELRSGRKVTVEVESWLKKLDLAKWASQKVQALSKGMSQKVQFIAAVVPAPKLLILDEPFSGLDPVSADTIQSAILELRRGGVTVILSTHDMQVAENMCDYICMIFPREEGPRRHPRIHPGSIRKRYHPGGGRRWHTVSRWPAGRGKDSRSRPSPGAAHGARLRSAAGVAYPDRAHPRDQLFHNETIAARHLRAHCRPGGRGGASCIGFC